MIVSAKNGKHQTQRNIHRYLHRVASCALLGVPHRRSGLQASCQAGAVHMRNILWLRHFLC